MQIGRGRCQCTVMIEHADDTLERRIVMKRRTKKIFAAMLVFTILIMNTAIVTNAAAESFYFSLTNNGQNWSYNANGGLNQKSYSGQNWSMKITKLSFSTNSYGSGMGYRLINSNTANVSHNIWATSTGVYYGAWWSDPGAAGSQYYLQGRTCDTLQGSATSYGYWNSDVISNWPS